MLENIKDYNSFFLLGCSECATLCATGGEPELQEMKELLESEGKKVTGTFVAKTGCQVLGTKVELKKAFKSEVDDADCILVMSCALGLFKIGSYVEKSCIPAQDTLFIGVESTPGNFQEVCAQCGQCVLGFTAGICPITFCHKSLINGPCGGTNNGKCEVDKEKDCAWTLIYNRLNKLGKLDLMRKRLPPKNYQASVKPRKVKIT